MSAQPKLVQELSVFEQVQATSPVDLFSKDKLAGLIKMIQTEVNSQQPDTSKKQGRVAIASFAYKIAKAKNRVDNAGKELGTQYREQLNELNGMRAVAKSHFESLQRVARKPLDDWEAADAERKAVEHRELEQAAEAERLAIELAADHETALLQNTIFDQQREIAEKEAARQEAEDKRLAVEQAEAERRAAEQAKADRIKRDEQIRIAALKQAKADRVEAERIAKENEDRAEHDRIEAERIVEELAAQVEAERVEAIKAAEQAEAVAVAEARRQEQQRARDLELERQAEEDRRREEANRKAANRLHRKKVHNAAMKSLDKAGINGAATIVDLIASGKISNIHISYIHISY